MRTSLFLFIGERGDAPVVDDYLARLVQARDEGFTMIWTAQSPRGPDVLTVLARVLPEVEGIHVGTGVIPIQTRHPLVLAQQALTVSAISGGRLTLGIGMTHRVVSEGVYGISWDRHVRRLNDYLDGLLPALSGHEADAVGTITTSRGRVTVPGATPPPVYIAALGPRLLDITGRRAVGTVTWMAGPRTLASHVIPCLEEVAGPSGRRVEVVAGFPICVTDQAEAARAHTARALALYNGLPSYRAMLDREGVDGPADVAIIGDEDLVTARLDELEALGIDELMATVIAPTAEDAARTRALLRART